MTRRSGTLRIFDFSGGLNTNSPVTSLEINQSLNLQNINLLPNGGFEKRRGNTEFNSSAMVSGSTAVTGLGYYRGKDLGTEYLMAIAGTKIFKSDGLDGTMDDISAALTITSSQDNIWTHTNFNDLSIFVGGAPDAPIKWDGSGNAAVLGGTPPNGAFGISANNRMFIGNTSANSSRIAWSVLGDPDDWSGTGSGTQDVQTNDGDTLVGAAILNMDHMILFKQNSIHDLVIRNSPFPLFPLFTGVGAVSKHGIVTVNGRAYFITPEPRMKATDGKQIFDFPEFIDDRWNNLNTARLKFIQGVHNPRTDQIIWMVSDSTASTHDLAIVWDLRREAWLRHPTGYKMNTSTITQDGTIYMGAYDGKIYKQDVASIFTDASETSPGAIDEFWRSGWIDLEAMIESKYFPYYQSNFVTQTVGTFDISYGFNFTEDRKTDIISMVSFGGKWDEEDWDVLKWGGQSDQTKTTFSKGVGKYFQFLIRNSNASENHQFNGLEIPINKSSQTALKSG